MQDLPSCGGTSEIQNFTLSIKGQFYQEMTLENTTL